MPTATKKVAEILIALAAIMAAGCSKPEVKPPPVAYYIDAQALQGGDRRVLFAPLANETNCPTASTGMAVALFQSIQGRRQFQLISEVPTTGPDGDPLFDSGHMMSMKDLAEIRRQTHCDAILLGAVTSFSPYPSLKIGLYLRLVDLRDSRVLWSIDHVWDSTDKATQERIECYFHEKRGDKYDPIHWRLATVSPATLQQFVAYEVAETLPCPTEVAGRR